MDTDGGDEGEGEGEDCAADLTASVRFWSDYSRVYYHPRGLHRVPDPAEWEREVGWAQGVERFASYDAVRALCVAFWCRAPYVRRTTELIVFFLGGTCICTG
jgi:Tubulin domain